MEPTDHSRTTATGRPEHDRGSVPDAAPGTDASADVGGGGRVGDGSGAVLDVPAAEHPDAMCRHCGRPFPRDRLRILHVGEAHAEALSDEEQTAYVEAREDESGDLFIYHAKVVAALSVLYTVFVLAYMVVLTLGG